MKEELNRLIVSVAAKVMRERERERSTVVNRVCFLLEATKTRNYSSTRVGEDSIIEERCLFIVPMAGERRRSVRGP